MSRQTGEFYLAVATGVNVTGVPVAVSVTGGPSPGDLIQNAIVLTSTNVSYPVGTDVTSSYYTPATGALGARGQLTTSSGDIYQSGNLSNTLVLLLMQVGPVAG